MAEGAPRTPGAAGPFADGEPQPARREPLRVVVPDHQPRRLGLHGLAAGPQELAQERGNVRGGSVRPSPGGAQLPPEGAVPIPTPGLRVATPRFGRGTPHLARDHLFQLEPPESL